MAETTAISWCDRTFSPWEGCTKVSPGCNHCYAEARNQRFAKGANWGPNAPRRRTADWTKPLRWNREAEADGKRISVFPSLCDPFDNEVPVVWRWDLFRLINATPNLDWLLLTKRIGNARSMLNDAASAVAAEFIGAAEWDRSPWPNVFLGATVVNQEEAERDIPKLLATPARVRFLSLEPMLGPVDLTRVYAIRHAAPVNVLAPNGCAQHAPGYCLGDCPWRWRALDWVIVGGESGPHARPLHIDWVRTIVQDCAAAGVPCHVKQIGHVVLDDGMSSPGQHWTWGTIRHPRPRLRDEDPGFEVRLKHPKGGDPAEWPEDLRIQQFPTVSGSHN